MKFHFLILLVALGALVVSFNMPLSTEISHPVKLFPPLKAPATLKTDSLLVDIGRYLFYDPILSSDSTISCSSCHIQSRAFSDNSKRFSTGVNDSSTTRNSMPLFNLAWNSHFFWDGRVTSIEEQVLHPVRSINEMNLSWTEAENRISSSAFYRLKFEKLNLKIDSLSIAKAIAQFEITIVSDNSKFDSVIRGETKFTEIEREGFLIVNDQSQGDCLQCHPTDAGSLGTTLEFTNNGISQVDNLKEYPDFGYWINTKDSTDIGKFKTPTLRNIMLTDPYMHDGRFSTIEEVLDHYNKNLQPTLNIDPKMRYASAHGANLNEEQISAIIAFLHTLTDKALLSDPALSNPFK
jgi:cytochrome c peroxidase